MVAAAEPTVAAAGQGHPLMVPPAELLVDPRRFQFRVSVVNLTGTDGRLRDACRWNPALAGVLLVWRQPDGRLALVDGHHRHRLAVANGVALVACLPIAAANATAARVIGAVSNLANGTATAVDLAKLMRDQGMAARDVEAYGVSRRSKVLADAAGLSRLDDGLFVRVATGELPVDVGLALAAAGPAASQRALAKEAKRQRWSAEQIREAATLAELATVTTSTPTGLLPGLEALLEAENSNLGTLLAVRAQIKRVLKAEVKALATVAKHSSADALEAMEVAVVDRRAAQDARDVGRVQQRVFNHLAGHAGPLQEVIKALAAEVSDQRSAAAVVRENTWRVRAAIEAELSA